MIVDEVQIEESGRRAWAWIVRNVDGFLAAGGSELRRVKRVAELALVAGTLCADDSEDAAALLELAWTAVGRGERIASLLEVEPLAAASYLPFCMAGLRSCALEQRLAEGSWRREHARWRPFGRLAVGVTLERVGIEPPWDQAETVAANRFFDQPTSQSSPAQAAYLAHAVMWRTEMGRNRAGVGPKATAMYRAVAAQWHPLLAAADLLDPLGEMVIADACTGSPRSATALAMLCDAQRVDGAVPARTTVTATDFEGVYHSTCVAALAATLSARAPKKAATDYADIFVD